MWRFISSVLHGKADGGNESDDRSPSSAGSEESDLSEETFEDCLEGDSDASSLEESYVSEKMAISSLHSPLPSIGVVRAPSHNGSFGGQAETSSVNSFRHFKSIAPHPNGISAREFDFRLGDTWTDTADRSSVGISFRQGGWEELSESSSPFYKRGRLPSTPEGGYGSNASSALGSHPRVQRIPTAFPCEEFTPPAHGRLSESGPWSCALSCSPRRVVSGQPVSAPWVLNERGIAAHSYENGVAVRPSPWSDVKCGVRARGSGARHPLGEDLGSFNKLLDDARQDDIRLATHPSKPFDGGTSVASFGGGNSPCQTCCSSTTNILRSQNSLGAFPLTNSPNCTVDRDSRQLSQLRFPQQRQGVNESSEKNAFDPVSSFGNISLNPQSEERGQRQSHGGRSVQWPQLTEHLSVLGNLDFSSKVFPVLTRVNGTSLDESFTKEELQDLGGVPKEEVNKYLWYVDGVHCRRTIELPPKRNAGAPSVFRCIVHRKGNVTFQTGEEKNQASTLLQRVLGFDRVLKVIFEDGGGKKPTPAQREAYHRIAGNGIFAGLRRYQYFAHKLSEKSEQKSEGNVKCVFVCTESKAEADLRDPQFRQFRTIADVRCFFMHIHTTENLSKYNSRLQLVLSKTLTVDLDWSAVNIEEMDDVRCKDEFGRELEGISTDGTGFISIDLAKKIGTNVWKGRRSKRTSSNVVEDEYSSIFQVRLFLDGIACKGTLAANCELPPNTIRCYKSMVKVRRDNRVTKNFSVTSFELVSTSRRTNGKGKLSRDLIALLSLCKVPEAFFIKHLTAAMEKSYLVFSDPKVALEEILDWESDKADLLADMISAKISLQEPFLRKSLLDMSKSKVQDLTKGKFPVDGTHNLFASADPTGTLKRNQVTITLSEGPVYCSKVLVYRAPGKHPGDIHVFQATCTEELEAKIGIGKYAFYFSTQGPRPITEEIGKGDLDGDRYWVSKNPELISYFQEWHCRWEKSPPATIVGNIPRKPAELSPDKLERDLFELFLDSCFENKYRVGKISNRWLKHMDEHLHIKDELSEKKWAHLEEALKLPSRLYEALDYAQKGIEPRRIDEELYARRPHYIETQMKGVGVDLFSYTSKSILAKIYDMAVSAENKWCLPAYDNFELDVGFQIGNYESHLEPWTELFNTYRGEMAFAMEEKTTGSNKSTEPERLILKYRKILYGDCSSFKEAEVLGKKERQVILEEASAIYTVVYEAGKKYISEGKEPRLSFAWNVAGEALCEIYSRRQPGRSLHMSFGYFKEMFERNRSKHQAPRSPDHFSE